MKNTTDKLRAVDLPRLVSGRSVVWTHRHEFGTDRLIYRLVSINGEHATVINDVGFRFGVKVCDLSPFSPANEKHLP